MHVGYIVAHYLTEKKVTFTVFVILPQSEHTEYLPLSLMGLDFDRFGKKGVCEGASGGGDPSHSNNVWCLTSVEGPHALGKMTACRVSSGTAQASLRAFEPAAVLFFVAMGKRERDLHIHASKTQSLRQSDRRTHSYWIILTIRLTTSERLRKQRLPQKTRWLAGMQMSLAYVSGTNSLTQDKLTEATLT